MKINNTDIRDHGFRVQQIHNNPLLPDFDHITSGTIAGRTGELYSRTQIKPKYISFEIHVEGEVEVKSEQFKRYFMDMYGKFVETLVQFDYSDKYILARLNGILPIQRHPTHGIINVELVQLDPFSYSTSEVTVNSSTFPVRLTGPTGMWHNRPYIQFTFNASTSDFVLTHVTTGKVVRIIHSFQVGNILYIDMEEESVFKGSTNVIVDLDRTSRFFDITAGINDITTNTAGSIMIVYRPKYL